MPRAFWFPSGRWWRALLGLRAAGATLGWGFQFQSPVFLALMAGLLFFLGLSLAGQFEIGLTLTSAGGGACGRSRATRAASLPACWPWWWPRPAPRRLWARPSATRWRSRPAVTFAVFTALALGLAAPYVALTLQPAWTRLLPRPGAWMEILRQAISVPIFATVIWLAWVLAQGLRRGAAGVRCWQLSAAGHCRLVPGPLAGQALVHDRCRAILCCAWSALAVFAPGSLRPVRR